MILKLNPEPSDCICNQKLQVYKLQQKFIDLLNLPENIKIFDNNYQELTPSTHYIFINDIVNDDWLADYQLQLYKQINQTLIDNKTNLQLTNQLNKTLDKIKTTLLMLDLPINFKQDFSVNVKLLKYLKLENNNPQTPTDLFFNLLKIHQFICSQKLLIVNHLTDYNLINSTTKEKVKNMQLNVIALV